MVSVSKCGRTFKTDSAGLRHCEKSVLLRTYFYLGSGELLLRGKDVAHADRATLKRLRPQVQMVFQNPYVIASAHPPGLRPACAG